MSVTVLILPGYGDSGPDHWQTLWERRHGYARVVQDDWERPDVDAWKERLGEAIAASPGRVVLVAHSLGCALVAHAARSKFLVETARHAVSAFPLAYFFTHHENVVVTPHLVMQRLVNRS